MSLVQDLGKVSVTVAGEWSSVQPYTRLDIVSYQGASYIAIKDVPSGIVLLDPSYWLCIAEKGGKGDKGDKGDTGDTGATGNGIVSVEKTGTSGNVDTYTITYTDGSTTTFTVTNGAVTSVDGKTGDVTLSNKADIDGSYEDLTAGSAEQLLSSVYVEDNTPYLFRTSGGNLEIGNREEQRKIVGTSVVQNQLINPDSSQSSGTTDGVTVTNNKDGSYTLSGTKTANANTYYYLMYSLPVGSKYVICGANTANAGAGGASGGYNLFCAYLNAGTSFAKQLGSQPLIINPSDTTKEGWRLQIQIGNANGAINTYNDTIKPMVINLTQRFGAEFADWLYSLTRAKYTEILYQLIPELNGGFIPYNTGVLGSVNVSKHRMTGFNQYNPNTDVVRVIRDNQYQITGSYTSLTGEDGSTITPDANGYFTPTKTQAVSVAGGNFTDTCVHLVWDGERDGEFEEYKTHEYDYDSSVELRGMLKIDENGNIYTDGDEYKADGSVKRKRGIANLGTAITSWNYEQRGGYGRFEAIQKLAGASTSGGTDINILCGKYAPNSSLISANAVNKAICLYNGTVYIRDDSYTTSAQLVTALQNVWIIYPLATITEETANPYTETQVVDNWGTEEFVDAQGRNFVIPVGQVTDYPQDLKAKLETAPNAPTANGDYIVRQSSNGTEYVPYVEPTTDFMTSVTYSELVALVNGNGLVAGMKYRITDYVTKINGVYDISAVVGQTAYFPYCKSAEHAFDLIVTAIDESTLDEHAVATQHAGDTYFANNALEAWDIKYTIENDPTKYIWADATNGKGVIFHMRDEYGNEAGYDFKNLLVVAYALTGIDGYNDELVYDATNQPKRYGSSFAVFHTLSRYLQSGSYNPPFAKYDFAVGANILGIIQFSEITDTFLTTFNAGLYYTFDVLSSDFTTHIDGSLNNGAGRVVGNVIEPCLDALYGFLGMSSVPMGLNCTIFENIDVTSKRAVIFNHIRGKAYLNIFGDDCSNNDIGEASYGNVFGNSCYFNTFGYDCQINTFGNDCQFNTFGNNIDTQSYTGFSGKWVMRNSNDVVKAFNPADLVQ